MSSSSSENEMPCCPICFQPFDCENIIPIVYSCGHSICIDCDKNSENKMEKCHTCRKSIISRVSNYILIETLKIFERQVEEAENSENNFQCSNCQNWMFDRNMHICKTCIIDESVLAKVHLDERVRKVEEVSLCSNCIVPMHSYKGHDIVAMFPIWSDCKFSLHTTKINWQLKKYEVVSKLIDHSFSDFIDLSIQVPEKYNTMSGIASKIKSLDKKDAIFEKMKVFIKKCKSIHVEVKDHLTSHTSFTQTKKSTPLTDLEVFKDALITSGEAMSFFKSLCDKGVEECNQLIDSAQKSKSAGGQYELFEKMEADITDMTEFNFEVRLKLESSKSNIAKYFMMIDQWCGQNCSTNGYRIFKQRLDELQF